ncbi:uncharacterized protein LOC129591131 [Paramacrobiotus metropolitanus]|uniref:uncharacterized protein LOC129591131 n=1 Tax=Paramacrobiotus metropolitanus TaxID=2943436 RepID=UPI0024458E64|nr:uncharacterized protein LOC129591131 [Paramacrobiotus metropolitanus]
MNIFIYSSIAFAVLLLLPGSNDGSKSWKKKKYYFKSQKRYFCDSRSRHHPSYHRVPAPCAANANPQLSSHIKPMPIDPYRMLGKWYQPLVFYNNASVNSLGYNFAVYYNNIGNETLLAGTDTPALLIEYYESAIDADTQKCGTNVALNQLAANGRMRQLWFYSFITDPTQYGTALWPDVVASTDYDSYAIIYECDRVSNTSRSACEEPYIAVLTRDRPDLVSSAVITRVSKEIDRILGKYCFDASHLLTRPWYPALGECPLYRPSIDCYTKQYDAWKLLAGTGPGNGQITPDSGPQTVQFFG